MPKFEKTLRGDIDDIDRKLGQFIMANNPLTKKHGTWTTEFGGCKCIFTVFEKHAKKLWDGAEWKDQAHYSLSLNLIDTGEEVRLCAITAGSSQDLYFCPDTGPEGQLLDSLKMAVEMLDRII